ncbi:MAG: 3-isopropylmalate dehydratase small subunit [Spirochaetaceae bacterium]|jgi:3-isopropylmalate/(R)-2-methylmalate dehydratase small subunit|nr:3-isopropylmalate dehydratase small subunit [Spirochaetaceae bacterium]
MKKFGGNVLFLDRDDINTDEIIPAKYLTENFKDALGPYLLEDLKIPGFEVSQIAGKGAVLSRRNFGCGSSREHAPWAFEANGVHIIVAESFARIFRQNMYNCGMLALELSGAVLAELFRDFAPAETALSVDLPGGLLRFTSGGKEKSIPFALTDFERSLVEAGGWVEYAAARY